MPRTSDHSKPPLSHQGWLRQRFAIGVLTLLLLVPARAALPPRPLPDHPGNVFIKGETAILHPPFTNYLSVVIRDFEGHEQLKREVPEADVKLIGLPVGWFAAEFKGEEGLAATNFMAVLEPLKVPISTNTPVGIDSVMAWLFKPDQMGAAANLCSLAGLMRARDRFNWVEISPAKDSPQTSQRHDLSLAALRSAGISVLTVNHYTPAWAGTNASRYPADLRDAYRFYRQFAQQHAADVQAVEPWNEPDINVFGGHTGSEIASMQKAAYLGLKAGAPGMLVCQQPFASYTPAILQDFQANRAAAATDTMNIHHYIDPEGYDVLYDHFRPFAQGRPVWVTEANHPVWWTGDEATKEMTAADRREQAFRVGRVYAGSLSEGPEAVYYFTLAHYAEDRNQYGLLRPDLTPRPAYVAAAAAGRLLAEAHPIGHLASLPAKAHASVFKSKVDGEARDVMVCWTMGSNITLRLPGKPTAIYDFLGRGVPVTTNIVTMTPAPQYVVLEEGAARKLNLAPAPKSQNPSKAKPSQVVIQSNWPQSRVVLSQSAYMADAGKPANLPLYIYNFSTNRIKGMLRARLPDGWSASTLPPVEIAPGGRVVLTMTLGVPDGSAKLEGAIEIAGEFGAAGQSILSLPFIWDEARPPATAQVSSVANHAEASRWSGSASDGGPCQLKGGPAGVVVSARPAGKNKWVYPKLEITNRDPLPSDVSAIEADITLMEGSGEFHAVFEEANGSSYIVPLKPVLRKGRSTRTFGVLKRAEWGATWSLADPNGSIDPIQIRSIRIGCNTKDNQIRFRLEGLRWLRY